MSKNFESQGARPEVMGLAIAADTFWLEILTFPTTRKNVYIFIKPQLSVQDILS